MPIKTLNCEEEFIHLCGKIQNFGYLLVFNHDLYCIAISENCCDWLKVNATEVLNKDFEYFKPYIHSEKPFSFAFNDLDSHAITQKVKLHDKDYQLTIYKCNNQIFVEFEEKEDIVIELSQLNELQLKIDKEGDPWQMLCDNIFEIIDFDRIMVYQFLEDDSGTVIAEHTKDGIEKLKGYHYPDFDIPIQARELYLKNLSRQTADTKGDTPAIIGMEPSEIDLSLSQIRALSPIHLQYLDNFGVRASASFSIIIDNKLWGLLSCHNTTAKHIPYDQRSLSLFLTQYAANSYIIKQQKARILQNAIINEIELELKEKLHQNQSVEKVLCLFADRFMLLTSSTGFVLKFVDTTYRYGDTPSEQILHVIHEEINNSDISNNMYTTHSFSHLDKGIDNHNWTGIARLSFDKEHNYSIYLFRKEILIEEKWAGIPEKYPIFSKEKNAIIYSPRTSFQVWTKAVKGQSEKWTAFDLKFFKRIHKQVQNSIVQKIAKIHQMNEQLIEINNQLETYTHQLNHDLKNPLTIIKINAQFIQSHPDLSEEMSNKFSSSIIEAASLINDIMDKTLDSTKATPSVLTYDYIQTENFIKQLIEQASKKFKIENFNLTLGDLHPVLGEKTLLYQLFMNLINNAIKFSSKQEITNLEINSYKKTNNTIYIVKDNGIGIGEDEKATIFSMFKRLSNADQFEGTGVGMSIVKRIVDRLNATIEIDSQIGLGTTFKITFPNE